VRSRATSARHAAVPARTEGRSEEAHEADRDAEEKKRLLHYD